MEEVLAGLTLGTALGCGLRPTLTTPCAEDAIRASFRSTVAICTPTGGAKCLSTRIRPR
jgi:hypothetical protein